MGAFVANDGQRVHSRGLCLRTGILPVGFSGAKKRMVRLFSAGAIFRAALCRRKRPLADEFPTIFHEPLLVGDTGWTRVWKTGQPAVVVRIDRGNHGFVYHGFRFARTRDCWRIDDFARHQTSADGKGKFNYARFLPGCHWVGFGSPRYDGRGPSLAGAYVDGIHLRLGAQPDLAVFPHSGNGVPDSLAPGFPGGPVFSAKLSGTAGGRVSAGIGTVGRLAISRACLWTRELWGHYSG